MTKRIAFLAVALMTVVAAAASAQAAQVQGAIINKSKLLTSVQGTWVMTTANGQDMAGAGQDVQVTITDDKYVQTVNGQVVEKGSFKLDDTRKPIALDLLIAEGEQANQKQLGILEIDPTGKTMRVALSQPSGPTRPSTFAMAEGIESFVFTKK